jgi:hypothetical protein
VLPFKQATLKMIVSRLLVHQQDTHALNVNARYLTAEKLTIPGELTLDEIEILALDNGQQYHICISSHQARRGTLRSEIMKVATAVPLSRRPSRVPSFSLSFDSQPATKGQTGGSALIPIQELQVGVMGQSGCTLQNSSNLLLLLSIESLRNTDLMADVREALLLGVHVITVHDKGTRTQA